MDSFEVNKIIAAILMVALLVIGLGKIADSVFHVKKPKNPGYQVEVEKQLTSDTSQMVEAEEKKEADEKTEEGEAKVAKETPEIDTFMTTYFEFPGTFTTNLMNSRRFLQVGLGVSTQYDDTVMENVEAHQLALRSEILNAISEFSESDIAGKNGREQLAKALTVAINNKLLALEDFGGITEVHYTSFVLQ